MRAAEINPEQWLMLSDCPPQVVAQIGAQAHCFTCRTDFASFNEQKSFDLRNNRLDREMDILEMVRQELGSIVHVATVPLLFFYLDHNCTLLEVIGDEREKAKVNASHIGVGVQFTAAKAGIHSITLAALLGQAVVVKLREHHLRLFHRHLSLCRPIIINDQRMGYVAMSYCAQENSLFFAQMIMNMVTARISKRLEARIQFQLYQLTSREEAVALQWLRNESVSQIADQLGITAGTVKNYVKKIYMKTGVSSRGEFILRFVNYAHTEDATFPLCATTVPEVRL